MEGEDAFVISGIVTQYYQGLLRKGDGGSCAMQRCGGGGVKEDNKKETQREINEASDVCVCDLLQDRRSSSSVVTCLSRPRRLILVDCVCISIYTGLFVQCVHVSLRACDMSVDSRSILGRGAMSACRCERAREMQRASQRAAEHTG